MLLTAAVNAAIGGHVDDMPRPDRAHVAQRHEQPDLELVGIHEAGDDFAACNLLSRATDTVGDDAGEGCRQPGTCQLVVRLSEQRPCHLQVRGRQIPVRLRLVDREPRHGTTRGTQPLELAVEAGEIHARALHAGGLLGPGQRELPGVEPGHEVAGFHDGAGFGDPLQPAGDRRREIGRRAGAHHAGGTHLRRELAHLGFGDLDRSGRTLLAERGSDRDGRQRREHRACCAGYRADCLQAGSPESTAAGARTRSAERSSPRRSRLGSSTQVNRVPTVMPPATTAASPR
jgi:hypothetical protein